MVTVPNLTDLSLKMATARLETYGFKLGKITYVAGIGKNLIKEQYYKNKKIDSNIKIEKGSTIDLMVEKGKTNEKTFVPYLIGLTKDGAQNRLTSAGLNLGAVFYDNQNIKTKHDSITAQVYKQVPLAGGGSALFMGESVDIYVTKNSDKVKVDTTEINNQ